MKLLLLFSLALFLSFIPWQPEALAQRGPGFRQAPDRAPTATVRRSSPNGVGFGSTPRSQIGFTDSGSGLGFTGSATGPGFGGSAVGPGFNGRAMGPGFDAHFYQFDGIPAEDPSQAPDLQSPPVPPNRPIGF